MDTQKGKEDRVRGNPEDSKAAGSMDVACSHCSADWESNTWLISSRSTRTSGTTGETTMGPNKGSHVLGREQLKETLLSDDFRADASTKTRGVIRTSAEGSQIREQRGRDVTTAMLSSVISEDDAREVLLEQTTTNQLAAQEHNKAEETEQKIATGSKLTRPLTSRSASAQNNSSSLKGQIIWHEDSKEAVAKGKDGTRGGGEDYILFSDSESTTVSSRRSSGLSQVEGTAKCLEELVAYAEEELAEQHLHFERLQSFCEVIADEDYEFAPFDCSVEFSTSWKRKIDNVLPSPCCTSASASLLKLHKLCASEEPDHAGSSEPLRLPYSGGDLSVAPHHTVVGDGAHVLNEEAVAKNVQWFRNSTDKRVQVDGPARKNGPAPGFTDACDARTLTVAAATSVFTGLEKIFTLAEGPSCISCGRSMSCSRCYTKMDMLVSCPARTVNHNVSLQSASSGASTGMPHACGTVGDRHSRRAADEVANREMNGFVIGGGCRRCASNIYCLTCLEHMQEQTAGLHADGDSRILQATLGRGSSERRSSVEVAPLLAVRKAFAQQRSASGQEGEEEVLHLVVRPQRLPGLFQGVCTNSAFISGEPDTGLACRLDACVGLHDMAEGYRPRTGDSTAVIGRQNREAWAMCTTCHVLLGTGNVRKVSSSDCEGPHQNASFLSLARGHLHALRVDLRKDIIGMTCSVPVRGVKDNQKTKGEFEKHQYVTSSDTPPHGSKTEVEWGPSQLLQPQQRFRVVETSENDSARPGFESLNADVTGIEDVSQLVLGTSCTMELRSYRERTERPGGEYGKVLYPEQLFSDVLSRKQKGRTCLGRRSETGAQSCCGARELQGWGDGSSGIQYGGTNTCLHALGRCQGETCLWKQEQKSSGEDNHVKTRSLSVSRIGKQESMCRGAPSAAGCFSLVPEQRMETVVLAVPVQRGEHVDDQTSVNAAGLRGGWSAHTLDVPETDRKGSFQMPQNENCTHQVHQLALCKYEMSSTSITPAEQVGVDMCFSSHSFQCPQDTRPPHGCHRHVGCSSAANLHLSPGALQAGRAGEGVDGEELATTSGVGGPPAVLRTTTGVQKAFSTYRDSGANLDPCGGGGGTPDKLAKSCSVKQWRRDSVAHANGVPSPPSGPEEREREGRTHTAEAGKQALGCETGGATETENWEDCTDTKMKNAAVFCRQLNPIAWNSIAVHSSEQEASEIARDEHWVTNDWQHSRSCQESAKAYSRDDVAATRRYGPPPRKDNEKSVHVKKIPEPSPVSDPLAVAAYPRNLQEVDSTCNVTFPAFLCNGSTTALTDYPAKVLPLSPNVALQHAASVQPGVVLQCRERGQQRCVSADSEFGCECNACVSEMGRPTGFSLTECTAETFIYCAREGRVSSGHPAHIYPNLTHHRQGGDCRVDVDCPRQSAAAGEAKRRRLESPEVRGSPTFTGRQGKRFTCNWSTRLSTTTLSIGSTLSTKSRESTYDCSPARTIHHRSRSELSDAGVRGGALKCVQPTAWMWSSLSSREHVDGAEQSTRDDPLLTVNLKCRPASDGRPQPVSLAFAAGGAAERCHNRQCNKIHGSSIFSGTPGTDGCGGILNVSDTGTVVPLTDDVAPRLYERPSSYSRDVGAFSRGYEVRQNGGLGGAPMMAGAVAADVAGRSQSGIRVGRCASHHNAHKKEMLKRASEHLVGKWINRRDETVVHQHHRTAGVVCRRPLSVKMPGSVPPGALHTEAKPAGPQFPAAVLPPVALQCSSPQPCSNASPGRELPTAVLPPVGTQYSSPQYCSVAPASSVEAVEEIDKKQFTFRAFAKHHATGASGVAELEEKHRRMENRRKCSGRDRSGAARAIPHRTTRQPRYEIKNGMAHGGTILKVGIKQADTDKKLFTAQGDDKQELREQTGVHGCEEYFIKGEADMASAAVDLLQNRCRIGRTRKPEIKRSRVTKTVTHGKPLAFGTSRNIGGSSKGCRTSRAAGRKNHLSGRGGITEERDSQTGTSLPSTSARPTAVDAATRAAFYSGASLSESVTSLAEACRRAFPKKGVPTKAGEGRKNDIVCRDIDDNVFTSEKTRKPWRTGADGKILYDACGHKISGVWYDTGRRLWRVVFTQGERRRTKGFSLRQYGFEQARNLAVQCKLAIEAGKALCEKESS